MTEPVPFSDLLNSLIDRIQQQADAETRAALTQEAEMRDIDLAAVQADLQNRVWVPVDDD